MYPRVESVRKGLCAEKAREALLKYSGGRERVRPPIKIESVAASLGFQVIPLYTVSDEFSGMVSTRQKLIGVNGTHHRHRRRFTIAHELAHVLLNHPPESHCTVRQIALYNAEADACAAELLIPTEIMTRKRLASKGLANLAYEFDVSEEAMQVKLRTVNKSSWGAKH